MLAADKISLFCPRNDLESDTILRIAEEMGIDCREVVGTWDLTMEQALAQHPTLRDLREQVVIVELSGDSERERLRQAGKIVHYIDHHDSPGAVAAVPRPSSLEQFAALTGHKLTRDQYLIAIADRDFLPGLSRVGASWAEVQELRRRERKVRGELDCYRKAEEHFQRNRRQLSELTMILAPCHFRNLMLDVAQMPRQKEYQSAAKDRRPVELPMVLAVFHDEQDRITEIRFAGPASNRPYVSALKADPRFSEGLKLWSGGGIDGCYLGAQADSAHPSPSFDALISRLLGYCLGTGTPLRHYNCTFLLPLDLFEDAELAHNPAVFNTPFDKDLERSVAAGQVRAHRTELIPHELWKDTDAEEMLETEARLYFLPTVQDAIYDVANEIPVGFANRRAVGLEPIRRWRLPRKDISALRWHLTGTPINARPVVARITDCSLYRYYNGLYALAISVAPEEELQPAARESDASAKRLASHRSDWWHPLLYADTACFKRIASLQLDHWLRFTKHARLLYRSFAEQVAENKFENQILKGGKRPIEWTAQGASLSPIVRDLLLRFFAPGEGQSIEALEKRLELQYLPEDRMFVNAAYALCGEPAADELAMERRERLFSLALYVDRASDGWDSEQGYAYDRTYTRWLMTEKGHRLDRWRGLGILSGYGPYANVHVGDGWFFANIVARRHVPYHYQRMLLLVLFYQLTLRGYNRRITHATNQLVEPDRKDKGASSDPGAAFRDLRRGFIEFTNSYWFREITLAIQGKEIFQRQVAAAELNDEYQEIKDEMERADEYVAALRDRGMNERLADVAVLGLLVAVLAVGEWYQVVILLVVLVPWIYCVVKPRRQGLCKWIRWLRSRMLDGGRS